MTAAPGSWLSRLEWRDRVGSTNDVVMAWLRDGAPEVCVALADEQTAGRGRTGRAWMAPAGAALLASIGFRPTYLEPAREWRLAAIVSLAMAEACESVAGVADGTIRLKWPNDLVAEIPAWGVCKLAGVLGESEGLGGDDPRVVVGIGVNAGWRRDDFPPELAASMTSLAELAALAGPDHSDGIDRRAVADAFLVALEPHFEQLRAGGFAAAAWLTRQLTNGRLVRLEQPDGSAETVRAVGADPESGALLVRSPDQPEAVRSVVVGEIRHLRIAQPGAVGSGV